MPPCCSPKPPAPKWRCLNRQNMQNGCVRGISLILSGCSSLSEDKGSHCPTRSLVILKARGIFKENAALLLSLKFTEKGESEELPSVPLCSVFITDQGRSGTAGQILSGAGASMHWLTNQSEVYVPRQQRHCCAGVQLFLVWPREP